MAVSDSPLTSIGVQGDPNYYAAYGTAVVSRGLQAQASAVNGVGLLTRGLVWQAGYVWFDPQRAANVSTGWTAALGYSGSAAAYTTGWTASFGYSGSAAAISTTWTFSQANNAVLFGEVPE